MKVENLKEGMVIKNYKELCKVLEIKERTSNSKNAQLKELERFVSYHKDGHKFIIDELYDIPKPKVENRGSNSSSRYRVPLERKILKLLEKSKDYQLCVPKYILSEELDLINFNYRYFNYNQKPIIEHLGVKRFDVEDFYNCTNANITYTIARTLDSLVNKNLIVYQMTLVARGSNKEGCYEVKNKKVLKKILTIRNEIMNTLGCKELREVIYRQKYSEYNKFVNKMLKSELGIEYVFDAYKVTSTKKIIEKALAKEYNCIDSSTINEDFLEQTIDNIHKRHSKAKLERKEIRDNAVEMSEYDMQEYDFFSAEEMSKCKSNTRRIYRSLDCYPSNGELIAISTIRNTNIVKIDD